MALRQFIVLFSSLKAWFRSDSQNHYEAHRVDFQGLTGDVIKSFFSNDKEMQSGRETRGLQLFTVVFG